MIAWAGDKLEAYRSRGWGWRALGVVLALATLAIAIAIIAWRRRAAERAAHDLFVAQVDARAAREADLAAAADAKLAALATAAAAAEARVATAAAAERAARRSHDEDLAAIDRVRTWRDVRPR